MAMFTLTRDQNRLLEKTESDIRLNSIHKGSEHYYVATVRFKPTKVDYASARSVDPQAAADEAMVLAVKAGKPMSTQERAAESDSLRSERDSARTELEALKAKVSSLEESAPPADTLDAMNKGELTALATERNVEFDKRWGENRLREALRDNS